ncbi:MAG: Ig-like domain repeat protein [Pseudomonadota bacterium]
MRGKILAIVMAVWAMLITSNVFAAEFQVLIDQDARPATGCTVNTPNGNFTGVEEILITTLNTAAFPPSVTGVSKQTCSSPPSTFSAPVTIDSSSWPVGLGVGAGGYDVIESYYPNPPEFGQWRLGFVYQDGAVGSDAVTLNSTGNDIRFLFGVAAIPTVSTIGIALLILMLGVTAFVRFRKSSSAVMLSASLLFVIVIAPVWATIAVVLDGQVGDWSDVSALVHDPMADAPAGSDISSVFMKRDGARVYFRADVKTAAFPTAVNDAYSIGSGAGLVVAAAPTGLLSNDSLGGPPATITFFGGGNASGGIASLPGATLNFGVANSGALTVNANGSFNYTPATGFVGPFTFNYRITNTVGTSDGQVTITVNPAGTSTVIGSSINPSSFGQSTTLTATIGVIAPGTGTPTGTVTFKDGVTTLGSSAVVSGTTATLSVGSLSAGSHSITAVYNGDASFTTSTSLPLSQVVSKTATTTGLVSSANPSQVAASVTFTATVAAVAPGAGLATGNVNFLDGVTPLGSVPLSGGVAQLSTSALAFGSHSITAVYVGDTNFNGSTSAVVSQNVNQSAFATADNYSVVHDVVLTVPAGSGLLFNDSGTPAPTVTTVTGTTSCTAPCTFATTNGNATVSADGSFTYTPGANFAGSDSFTYTAHNSSGDSVATVTITVSNVLPVVDLSGSAVAGNDYANPAGFTEGGGAVLVVDANPSTGLTVADSDSTNLASATVVITNVLDGASESLGLLCPEIAPACSGPILAADVVYTPATGTLTITRVAPQADYQALLRTLRYSNTSPNPTTTTRSISVTVNDGINDNSPVALSSVTISSVNNTPVLAAIEGTTLSYVVSSPATAITSTITVGDADSANLASASVQITNNCFSADDVLGFSSQNGITGVYSAATCTMALSGSASPANYQSALRSVTYSNANPATNTALRTVSFQVDDGEASSNLSNIVTRNVEVKVNVAPTITAGGTLSYLENQTATLIDATIVVNDTDSPNLTGATVQITTNCASAEDGLSVTTQNGISGVYTAGTCTLALTGSSTIANYQIALRSVQYVNSSNSPSTLARTISWQVNDGEVANNLSNTATSTVNFTSINDAPSFTKGADATVLEDSGAFSQAGWVTAVSAGAADESSQVLNFIVTNNNNALFSVQPAIDAAGALTFTPAANANGVATVSVQIHDDGGTANGGVDTSAVQTFMITVTAVNDIPSFTKGGDQTVLEDAAPQSVPGWATAVSAGPANESSQVLNFIVTNNNNALFSVQPTVGATGTLTYTLAANQNGAATVSVQIHDNGGTANGGVDTSIVQTFTITVTAVNDAPSFTKGADQAVLEDTGAHNVSGWATAISAGAADESSQVLNFIVTNNNNTLFSVQPAIDVAGVLTYTLAADQSGAATVSVQIHDNGGTANGAVDTSAVQTFTITVTNINDVPSFAKGANQTVLEDAVAQSVPGWATGISAGPNEGAQVVNFIVSNNNTTLFSVQPAVGATGTLTYTLAANQNGVATVSVQIHDNGGTANGGVDTSAVQTFTITVTPVNDAPVANAFSNLPAQAGIPITYPIGKLGGTDIDTGTTLVVNTTPDTTCTDCLLTLNADGSFTFTPPPASAGTTVSFTYHVTDDGNDNGQSGVPLNSIPATVSFDVAGPAIYFVKTSNVGSANCSLGNECTLSAALSDIGSATNTRIFISDAGTHIDSVLLRSNGWLIGQGVTAPDFDTLFTIAAPAQGTLAIRPSLGQTAPTISISTPGVNIVTLNGVATTNVVRGLNLTTGSSTTKAVSGTNFGTLTTGDIALSGSGPALDLSTGAVSGSFIGVSSSGGANGIKLSNVTGSSHFGIGNLSGATGNTFDVSGGTASLTYNGVITSGSARSVSVANKSGGTVTFGGLVTDNDAGISLATNPGTTINFNAGIDANTGTNAAFTASGGGTINVTQNNTSIVNTVTTTTGTAISLTGVAGAQTFRSVSVNGAATGISLVNTTGSFTITGNSAGNCGGVVVDKNTVPTAPVLADCTGGTIQNAATGIRLDNATNVSLTRMHITGTVADNFGIYGTNVNGFTLAKSVIDGSIGATTGGQDSALVFGKSNPAGINGLLGTNSITDSTISGAIEHNMEFYNQSGTFSLNIAKTVVSSNSVAGGADGIQMEMQGTANGTVAVDNSYFNDNKSQAIQAASNDTSSLNFAVRNSKWIRSTIGNEGVVFSNGASGDLTLDVDNNISTGFGGVGIFVGQTPGNATAGSNLVAKIQNNQVTSPTTATNHSVFVALTSTVGQVAPANILVQGNTVIQNSTSGTSRAILVDTPDTNTSPSFTASVINNAVSVGDNVAGVGPIVVQARQSSTGCFDVRNNTATFPNGDPGVNGVRVRQVAPAIASLEAGISGAGTAATVLDDNHSGATTEVLGTVTVVNNSTCAAAP